MSGPVDRSGMAGNWSMTTRSMKTARGDKIVGCKALDKLLNFSKMSGTSEKWYLTSALVPVVFNCRLLHSAFRSDLGRGNQADALAWESSRPDGRPAFALEVILRTVYVSLITGGVTLDMMSVLLRTDEMGEMGEMGACNGVRPGVHWSSRCEEMVINRREEKRRFVKLENLIFSAI